MRHAIFHLRLTKSASLDKDFMNDDYTYTFSLKQAFTALNPRIRQTLLILLFIVTFWVPILRNEKRRWHCKSAFKKRERAKKDDDVWPAIIERSQDITSGGKD